MIEQRHETEDHVKLLVTMEHGQPRIVSHKIHLGFLVSRCQQKDLHRVWSVCSKA